MMDFLNQLLWNQASAAHSIFLISAVVALGLTLGTLRFFGVSLGVAGVLFAGIFFGHFKVTLNSEILEFAREFGLVLFVYTVGMQVGTHFFSSFKREGLMLNFLAALVVLLGAVVTVILSVFARIPMPAAVGMFSGATTNTPSLAAAQQALKEIPGLSPETVMLPGLGYALAYPFGILGIIITMLLVRGVFRISVAKEAEAYTQLH